MTTDLEKQFFETFEIEQKKYTQCCSMGCKKPNKECGNCEYHEVYKVDYPQITDRILLELICIICPYGAVLAGDVEYLKQQTLENCIKLYEQIDIKHQVCKLF